MDLTRHQILLKVRSRRVLKVVRPVKQQKQAAKGLIALYREILWFLTLMEMV
ncbi:hypothetical protein Q672_16405 [Marinobacter sp. EVN1]|nr:hypothetical protein Q672_16405 [Marinobacter sp. EVN1]